MNRKARILLVEDEDIVAMLTEDMLDMLGHDVFETAPTLQAGLEIAASAAFDLAILDINLRGERSFPIADLLATRGIPYLFVSGYSQYGVEPRFARSVRLQKPFTLDALQDKIAEAFAQAV